MTEPLKIALTAAPLIPPVLGLATGDSLTTKTNLIPYNPVGLPLWAWFILAGVGAYYIHRQLH